MDLLNNQEDFIQNVLSFAEQADKLTQQYLNEQFIEMNKDLTNWDNLDTKDKMNLRLAFKEIINMSEIGKLIKENS
jgi:hypothetical protein